MEYSDDILQLIESYLRGTISEQDLLELNKVVKSDDSLAAQLNEFKEFVDVLDEDSWSITDFDQSIPKAKEYFDFYSNADNKAYFKQLENLDVDEYEKAPKENNRKNWIGLLAVAAVLVISFLIFNPFKKSGTETLIASNYDDIPTLTVRGESELDSLNALIDNYFDKQKYDLVTSVIEENQHRYSPDQLDLLYIYKGVSYTELKLFDKAFLTLSDKDIFSNSIYEQMADWYLAMSLLRSNNSTDAKKLLTKISKDDNHYKQSEAKKLLKGFTKREN